MKPIVLTAEQRKAIERRRKDTLDRRVYQRLTAVLAVAADKPREEVAELLGVSLSQLGEWLRIFRNEGLDALCQGWKGEGKVLRPGVEEGAERSGKQEVTDWPIGAIFFPAHGSVGGKPITSKERGLETTPGTVERLSRGDLGVDRRPSTIDLVALGARLTEGA
jgi:hypothetical protein